MAIIRYFFTLLVGYSFMFCVFVTGSNAATINAQSVSYSDVSAAVSAAHPGDIVVVPAGTATWSSQLRIEKGLILQGAGMASTTIVNGGVDYILHVQPAIPANNPVVIITGFTFDGNSVGGCLYIRNLNSTYDFDNFRIHNNTLKNAPSSCIYTRGMVFGLIDNNIFDNNYYHINTRGYDWYSWDKYTKADDDTLVYSSLGMGGARFLFIESNTVGGSANFFVASGEGSRWVARYNTIDGGSTASLFDIHGDTRNDGCVAIEIYENTETTAGNDMGLGMADYRGGTAMIYNNTVRVYPGLRCSIKVREETSPCGELRKGYDMRIHNGYMWNNKNTYREPPDRIYVQHHLQTDYDPRNCLTEQVDYWADTQDGTRTPTTYFTYDVAANRPGTCSDDDCYWETDTKKLYRCVGTNNWIFVYEPYAYPHPLIKPSTLRKYKIKN